MRAREYPAALYRCIRAMRSVSGGGAGLTWDLAPLKSSKMHGVLVSFA